VTKLQRLRDELGRRDYASSTIAEQSLDCGMTRAYHRD
jgi:hypothetical protein